MKKIKKSLSTVCGLTRIMMLIFACGLYCGDAVFAAAPAAPGLVSAADTPSDYGSKINITWTKSSDDGGGANSVTAYRIYRATAAAGYDFSRKHAVMPAGSQAYQDYAATDGMAYFYVVRAWDGAQESADSIEASASSVANLSGSVRTYKFIGDDADKWMYDAVDLVSNPPLSGPDITGQAAVNNNTYDSLGADDGTRLQTNKGTYDIQHFKFTIKELPEAIEKVRVLWNGYSEGGSAYLYIWNFASSTWSYITRDYNDSSDVTLTGSFGGHAADYVSSGYLHLLAQAGPASEKMYADYIEVAVTSVTVAVPVSAQAKDEVNGQVGIQTNDSVTIVFSEETNTPVINADNIDSVLVLSGGHSWKSGSGEIGLAGWISSKVLEVKLSADISAPTIAVGDTITPDGTVLKDKSGKGAAGSVLLQGSFAGTDNTAPEIASSEPQNGQAGVLTDAQLRVVFTKSMDIQKTQAAVTLERFKNASLKTFEEIIPVSCSFDPAGKVLTVKPVQALEKNKYFALKIGKQACGLGGLELEEEEVVTFKTIIDHQKINIVEEPGRVKIVVEENTFKKDFYIEIQENPENTANTVMLGKLQDAGEKADGSKGRFAVVISSTIVEVEVYTADNEAVNTNFSKPVYLSIAYPDADNDGMVDGVFQPIRVKTLRIYHLDQEHNLWVKVPGSSIDTGTKMLTAPCRHFSVYAILGALDTDLSDAYAFPVPFVPSRGDRDITFTNLSSLATIKIFTVSGELVRTIEHASGSGQEKWDGLNDTGEKSASGAYLYIIKNEKETKKGKLVVVR